MNIYYIFIFYLFIYLFIYLLYFQIWTIVVNYTGNVSISAVEGQAGLYINWFGGILHISPAGNLFQRNGFKTTGPRWFVVTIWSHAMSSNCYCIRKGLLNSQVGISGSLLYSWYLYDVGEIDDSWMVFPSVTWSWCFLVLDSGQSVYSCVTPPNHWIEIMKMKINPKYLDSLVLIYIDLIFAKMKVHFVHFTSLVLSLSVLMNHERIRGRQMLPPATFSVKLWRGMCLRLYNYIVIGRLFVTQAICILIIYTSNMFVLMYVIHTQRSWLCKWL